MAISEQTIRDAELLLIVHEIGTGNLTPTTPEVYELVEGGWIEKARTNAKAKIPRGSDGDEPLSNCPNKKVLMRLCPRCHKQCLGIYRRWVLNEEGKKYWYWYAAHYVKDHKVKWCYIGKDRTRKPRRKTSR